MASTYQSVDDQGRFREYLGVDGTNDEDVIIETTDIARFNTFLLSNGAGAVKVQVHDGQNWLTSPLSIADLGSTALDPVLLTAALRQYGWRGYYHKIRISQEGAVAATDVVLRCYNG
ncbi:hypothetical protein KAR91_36310 [Candidatus Pacearchaeota archaeon]|nr:hypothetical protein [Candidatus Pacearchaeota archaeon]